MARVAYPSDFDDVAKTRYRETKKFSEQDEGGWKDVYGSTLERYVRSWAWADKAQHISQVA
jgi:hypothetical protein